MEIIKKRNRKYKRKSRLEKQKTENELKDKRIEKFFEDYSQKRFQSKDNLSMGESNESEKDDPNYIDSNDKNKDSKDESNYKYK